MLEERNEHHKSEYEFLLNHLETRFEPSLIPPVTTDPGGRFRIRGIGRERVATLQLEGPTIETQRVEVRTRPGQTLRVAPWKGFGNANLVTIHGAVFDHVVGPTRPIEGSVRDQDTGKPLAGITVRGERSLSDSTNTYVQSISDIQGTYRLIGLPRGNEGAVVAVPPCDVEVYGSLDAAMKVPPPEELPYLRARVAVPAGAGRPAADRHPHEARSVGHRPGYRKGYRKAGPRLVEYFVTNDNPQLKEYPASRYSMIGPHLTAGDGAFRLVAFPGPGHADRARAMKIDTSEAVGYHHSSLHDSRWGSSRVIPGWLLLTNFTRWPRLTPHPAPHRSAITCCSKQVMRFPSRCWARTASR